MALHSRSHTKNNLLPSFITAFLKRRLSQLTGFFMICLGVALAAILITYHSTDPSWNLAIDGPTKNILAFPGAVLADMMLQTFGIAAGFWVIGFIGWGIRSMAAAPLSWTLFRVIALIGSALLAAGVAVQWTAPKSWLLPNSSGGAFGEILIHQSQKILGISLLSTIGMGFLFTLLSFSLLVLSLGIPFKTVGQCFRGIALAFKVTILFVYRGFLHLIFWGSGKIRGMSVREFNQPILSKSASPSHFKDLKSSSSEDHLKTPLVISSGHHEEAIHVTSEDQAIHEITTAPKEQKKTPIIWGKDLSVNPEEEKEVFEETLSFEPVRKAAKSSLFYDSTSDITPMGWEEYELPSLDLLDPSLRKTSQDIDPDALEESAYHLKTVLEEFGVRGEVVTVRPGPVVTMYEFKPAAGIKTSRVIGLADDIARSMSALSARIAVIPGRNVIGIELPNATRETVYLRELLQSESYEKTTTNLALILGKDIGGQPVIADLTRMPHLLVAGTTGSGKSVAVNTMILSLLFRLSPDRCKFIMIDPKMLELSVYDGIPHLLSPVVTDPKKAIVALKWAVREMENRYRAMSKLGVRNIDGYNARIKEAHQTGELLVRRVQTGFDPDSGKPIFENQPLDLNPLPYIVVVVDEMADLMMVAGKEIEAAVQRLAQMARAAGIHLIMATQRPSVDVITGTIKANFPTRISFQVTSKIDSRTILGEQGAEQLLGQGDMLYMAGGGRITRVHGPFVRDHEVERIVAFLKTQAEPVYIDGVTDDEDDLVSFDETGGRGGDALYTQAVDLVMRENKASTSFIQRHLQIGYNKAAGIIELMEKNGIVSQANHVGKREVLR
jgi:DNA segregation ATPase FtsK/SpoIIIE, S-DNA-T family